MWFFTSDWHLNSYDIIKKRRRFFLSSDELELLDLADKSIIDIESISVSKESIDRMNAAIIDNTNSVVEKNDNLVILGNFCWPNTKYRDLDKIFSSIKCRNIYLIWGNYDNRKTLSQYFSHTYYSYLFKIRGQYVFANHYPCKIWPYKNKSSWMLYGGSYGAFSYEDNGAFSPKEKQSLISILSPYVSNSKLDSVIFDMSNFLRKSDFTLDVGVDTIRNDEVSFGTPWSFDEIKSQIESRILEG